MKKRLVNLSDDHKAELRSGDKGAEKRLLDELQAKIFRREITLKDAREIFKEETAK